jgi:hypothetical protein
VAFSPTTSAALRYWNTARQRYCRRLARNGKPCASLPTRSPSQPRTPSRKAGVLDLRKPMRERDGLSAGGNWIRTSGSARDSVRFSWSRCLASASSRRPAEGLRRAIEVSFYRCGRWPRLVAHLGVPSCTSTGQGAAFATSGNRTIDGKGGGNTESINSRPVNPATGCMLPIPARRPLSMQPDLSIFSG